MTVDEDIETFEQVLENLHDDLLEHPFHYANEDLLVPELYARLRKTLDPETVELDYRQDYSDLNQWRNREMFNRTERNQNTPRVRPEVRFFGEGELWSEYFDLVVFAPSGPAVMQGKKQGIGNYVDVESDLSLIAELKHSMNMSGQFRDGGQTDVAALGEFPGTAKGRYFVFIDWWPRDGYGNPTFEKDLRGLEERLPPLDNPVDVAYLPRGEEMRLVRNVGD